jgi:transposase InsO family protein
MRQDFSAARPDTVWLADITYLPTGEGWLYLAAVLDLATRKIVGWSMRDHMRTALSVAALMMAAQRQRPAAGLICHSDRGSQYAAEAYRKQLASMGAMPSLSRTACCYDCESVDVAPEDLTLATIDPRVLALTCRFAGRRLTAGGDVTS